MGAQTRMFATVLENCFLEGKLQIGPTNVQTLAAAKVLVATDPPIQVLDPDSAGRNVDLPAEAGSRDLVFLIHNNAGAAGEDLTVRDDAAATIAVVSYNEAGLFYCDGVAWRGMVSSSLAAEVTATAAELNYLDITTLGTGAASKAVVLDSGEDYTWPAAGVLTYGVLNDSVTALAATALELNRANDVSARLVAAGASLTVTLALHDGKTIALDTSAGSALTLPAATGTGARIRVIVSVTASGGSHAIACVGTDEFAGVIYQVDTDTTDTVAAYPALAADNFDTITLNGGTTGGLIGDWIELEDVVAGTWAVRGHINSTDTVATPFTSAV